ncbi:transcription termination factor Rho [Akkermansiaceae bacterium]|nr:transcription termination factor Rho [Akkermansiaceae bacterium]
MIPPDSDSANSGGQQASESGNGNNNRNRNRGQRQGRVRGYGPRDENREGREPRERKPFEFTGDPVSVDGLFEVALKGFGFLRKQDQDFEQRKEDVFVPPDLVRQHGIRPGVWIKGIARDSSRGPQLTEVTSINGQKPEDARKLPAFEELKAINPSKQIGFETTPDRYTTRLVDLMAPVGRGQRGLIVSPPRSGKTTLLLHMAQAVQDRHEEHLHLIVLLVDERPEEVTEFRRQLPEAEIYASSNDESPRNHCRLAELCIERAKRLVEDGQHVFILMDSITRLARAYNNNMGGSKKSRGRGYQSGGIVAGALEMPRRLFAAARSTREAGSLTIIATALIQTNSKADEAIFQEFKGTGNMELVLDRRIAEQYVYPAADIFKSGTRREELILPEMSLKKIYMVRRGLAGHKPVEAMERLLFFMRKFPSNAQMLLEIKG